MIPFIIIIIFSAFFVRLIFINQEAAIYYFIPYNYLFDLVFFAAGQEGIWTTILTIMRVLLLLLFFFKTGNKRFFMVSKPSYGVFILISLIFLLSSILGHNDIKSILETLKFILIILSFFSFFLFFSYNPLNLAELKKMVLNLAIITVGNILLSNIFSFGWSGYSEDVGFYTGGLISNMWYIPALILVTAVAIIILNKKGSNLILLIASIAVLIILIIALRRSAYIILLVSLLSALIFLRISWKFMRIGIILFILAAISSPFFIPIFERQIEARTKTFDKGVDEESRVKETAVLWAERLETSSKFTFLFGEKPFNSVGNYGNGSFGDRPLHVDMNIIFFSSGLIGLILYILFYFNIFIRYLKLSRRFRRKDKEISAFKYLFFSSFFSLIALSFSGGLNAITFRMFGFLLMAIALGQLKYIYYANRNLYVINPDI